MSDDTDQSGASSDAGRSFPDTTGRWYPLLTEWYPVPVVGLLMAFMIWVRAQSWQRFVQHGTVYFGGNDPWYHYRQLTYVVHHWPRVMPFDPWTQFPYGTVVDQFGTLYDQITATVALVLGLGSPSEHLIRMVALFTPVVVSAFAAVGVYYVAKRLSGRFAGVIAVAVLAFLPGTFLRRGLVGTYDHNIAEPLFQVTAVAAIVLALYVAERDRPVWEQVAAREWTALKPVLGWSAIAGIAVALYTWVWPPAVLLVGITGVFFLVKLAGIHYNGKSPDHLACVGITSMTTAGVLMLVPFSTVGFAATKYSLLQPAASIGVAATCVVLAWLSRIFEARDVDRALYPITIGALTFIGIGVIAVVLPNVFNGLTTDFVRFIGFGSSATQRTVGEAQPWLSRLSHYGGSRFALFFSQYGLAFFVALAGLAWLLWRPFYDYADDRKRWFALVALVMTALVVAFPSVLPALAGAVGVNPTWTGVVVVGGLLLGSLVVGDHAAERSFVAIWTLFIIAAAFTQVRFNYYLALPVAALSGYAATVLLRLPSVGVPDSVSDINTTQVVAILAVILVLIVPLTVPVSLSTSRGNVKTNTAMQTGSHASPGAVLGWAPMLHWMQNNTPAEGNYGGANNANKLSYYGTYHKTNDYNYPNGSYGVMSWWDYGHWITVLGHRIPDANPFQGNAHYAARFLLAGNETRANHILNSKGAPQEQTRYVAVDWKMASINSKFGAPTVFDQNVSRYDFYRPLVTVNKTGKARITSEIHSQKYYDSMLVRLYRYQGSAQSPRPVVVTWDRNQGPYYVKRSRGSYIKQFNGTNAMQQAKSYVANHSRTSQIGGIGSYPSKYVPALKHYRLVGLSPQHVSYRQMLRGPRFRNLPYWAKLYERVPGATVHGTGPANTTVSASVTMDATQIGKNATFTYRQRAQTGPNGSFTMTLPYSTTGYGQYGPQNGHTNVSVRATGPYTFHAIGHSSSGSLLPWSGSANVSEGQVNGANSTPVSVSLNPG